MSEHCRLCVTAVKSEEHRVTLALLAGRHRSHNLASLQVLVRPPMLKSEQMPASPSTEEPQIQEPTSCPTVFVVGEFSELR
jgi:hypothetical protein